MTSTSVAVWCGIAVTLFNKTSAKKAAHCCILMHYFSVISQNIAIY